MRKILLLAMTLGFTMVAQAQRRYESVLRMVERNNPILQAARQNSEARQMEAHLGLMLPNPEVEVSLFRGDPVEQGTRWDLRVTQSFEMPSVYVRRARLRDLREHAAELDYAVVHNALMHEVQLLCAELIYANNVASILDRQTSAAISLIRLYEKRMAAGDCSVLEYNRAQMNLVEVQDKASRAVLRASHLYNDLLVLVGAESVDLVVSKYDTVVLPLMFDEWYDTAEMSNPRLRVLQNTVDTRQQELQFSRSQWLPSMSVGYVSETVTGSAFRGVSLGMTLPVWSQPRTVRQARLSYAAAQQELTARRVEAGNETRCLMHRLFALQNNLNNMRRAYATYNSRELLDKALEAGELSLEQYLLQVDFYVQQEIAIWDLAYELEKGYINLYAFTL